MNHIAGYVMVQALATPHPTALWLCPYEVQCLCAPSFAMKYSVDSIHLLGRFSISIHTAHGVCRSSGQTTSRQSQTVLSAIAAPYSAHRNIYRAVVEARPNTLNFQNTEGSNNDIMLGSHSAT